MGWCYSSSAGEADAGDANEGEMVRLVRPGAGTDEVGSAPQGSVSNSIVNNVR